jgi:uncharacterized membrane protein YkoI
MIKALPFAIGLIASIAVLPLVGATDLQRRGSISVNGLRENQYMQAAKVNMQEAVSTALKNQKGREISAMLDGKDGYLVYEVRVLNAENEYVNVFVDAGNGSILGIKRDLPS